jgi:hypothetical protein
MRAGKHLRPVSRSAAAVLALVAATGSGPLVAPAPARAADTVRGLQWYLDTPKIPQTHKITKGHGVTVAVLDKGVDPDVPDLRGQVLSGKGLGSDATADGRRSDDDYGHGTGMAGLIAGRGGGVMRQLGIAPEVRILPVSMGAAIDPSDAAEGIRWAADHGADVINMSFGGRGSGSPEEVAAVRYALEKNVVLVAAAGNRQQGALGVNTPANIPGVIAVTGLAKDGGLYSDSADGPEAVLAAPMQNIITPRPTRASNNGYGVPLVGAVILVIVLVRGSRRRRPAVPVGPPVGAPGNAPPFGHCSLPPGGAGTQGWPGYAPPPAGGPGPAGPPGPGPMAAGGTVPYGPPPGAPARQVPTWPPPTAPPPQAPPNPDWHHR